MFPSLNRTFVENRADYEKGSYGVGLQDLRELRGRNGRRWRYLVAYRRGTDDDVNFSRRANDRLHDGAVGNGSCVYCHCDLGELGFDVILDGSEGGERSTNDDDTVDSCSCKCFADAISDAASCVTLISYLLLMNMRWKGELGVRVTVQVRVCNTPPPVTNTVFPDTLSSGRSGET